jgi:hypothetical protein
MRNAIRYLCCGLHVVVEIKFLTRLNFGSLILSELKMGRLATAFAVSVIASMTIGPSIAQMSQSVNLSAYGGTHQEARNARGFCWDKVGLPKNRNPQTEAEAQAIRSCVDKVLAGNIPARSAPPAQSERGRCIQQLPGSVYNKETKRYSNSNSALVTEKCGRAS